mgnify:CR=1 FL=1
MLSLRIPINYLFYLLTLMNKIIYPGMFMSQFFKRAENADVLDGLGILPWGYLLETLYVIQPKVFRESSGRQG